MLMLIQLKKIANWVSMQQFFDSALKFMHLQLIFFAQKIKFYDFANVSYDFFERHFMIFFLLFGCGNDFVCRNTTKLCSIQSALMH